LLSSYLAEVAAVDSTTSEIIGVDEELAPPGRLQRSQAARRSRIIEAVLELAQAGGYDAVQLREVSERTGISTNTIYSYYSSRDVLIASAVHAWIEDEFIEPSVKWSTPATPAERVLFITKKIWDLWRRNPNMLETYMHAAETEGDKPDGLRAQALERVHPMLQAALRDVAPGLRYDLLMIHASTVHSVMSMVVSGHLAVGGAWPILERTIIRLCQHPGMDGHRPASWDYQPDREESPHELRAVTGILTARVGTE
jgi:AcrR family transcriptional regulator